MKALVTGANGMLGQDLCPILEVAGYEVVETDIKNLDITNEIQTLSVIKAENPDLVVHCAAYTNVDKAEEELEIASKINGLGTENVAKACAKTGAILVYISTDYVFDGTKETPYEPDDTPNPQNNYGLTKLQGENAVKKYCEKYYIARTSWHYGHHGKNYVETMIALAGVKPDSARADEAKRAELDDTAVTTEANADGVQQSSIAQAEMIALAGVKPDSARADEAKRAELKVVDDQVGCPTWTVELASGILKLLNKPYGTYHICGSGYTSWYGFAREIFSQYNLDVDLKPCTTEEFPRPAKRPRYSVMDNNKLCRNWKSALSDYLTLRDEEV